MANMSRPLLLDVSARGSSCARTIRAGLEDIAEVLGGAEFKPEVLHIVGAGDAELALDFSALAGALAPGARVLLAGPHATVAGGEAREELLGPVDRSGLQVSVFPHTYQRYMAVHHDAEAPQLVVLFHPGLDIHYFTWYPCLKYWVDSRIPVLLTAYKRPAGLGETPALVKTLLETLVGTGAGAGLSVMEEENPHSADDGSFNAGYFVFIGSQGALPILPEEMYFGIYQALSKESYPFAPRVGYLDMSEEDGRVDPANPRLLASIAEGALRAAQCGDDAADADTACAFAAHVLDAALGEGIGARWRETGSLGSFERPRCANCGDGYDSEAWHLSVCPAVGVRSALSVGDEVVLANLSSAAFNGREGVLDSFNRQKQRWVVRMGEKQALFKAVNLHRKSASS